ncbi:SRPBCC family protein [Pedococcus sp. KACC 23699]|uniref:SRPBCC family protein n=1 Tax=Pedococcus sp. KACC 23699 TaxID=3149228 RepID=A0AAU7JP94_9MICO
MLTRPTAAERGAALPGDELVAPADVVMDRAFSLPAPPEVVWPWLVQLGKRRAGWYLPAVVEGIVPRSRRGLRRLDAPYLDLAVGDVIPDWGGRDATFTVASLDPAHHLLHTSTRGRTHLTWCLRLTPEGHGTRLHLRLRMAPVKHRFLAARLGGLVDQLTVMGLAAGLRERVRARD